MQLQHEAAYTNLQMSNTTEDSAISAMEHYQVIFQTPLFSTPSEQLFANAHIKGVYGQQPTTNQPAAVLCHRPRGCMALAQTHLTHAANASICRYVDGGSSCFIGNSYSMNVALEPRAKMALVPTGPTAVFNDGDVKQLSATFSLTTFLADDTVTLSANGGTAFDVGCTTKPGKPTVVEEAATDTHLNSQHD
jgi:hypothetical protein